MMHAKKEGGSRRRQVREPVQVYLDERDRALLEAIAARSALSRAEILRPGLRRIAAEVLAEGRPGASLSSIPLSAVTVRGLLAGPQLWPPLGYLVLLQRIK